MRKRGHLLVTAIAVGSMLFAGYAAAQHRGPAAKPAAKHADPPKPTASAKPIAPTPAPAASTLPDPAKAPGAHAAPASSGGHDVVERESRIEFDERMVRGQTASGAIYLFQRSPSEFKSIVTVPDSFRSRTTDLLSSHRTEQ